MSASPRVEQGRSGILGPQATRGGGTRGGWEPWSQTSVLKNLQAVRPLYGAGTFWELESDWRLLKNCEIEINSDIGST